VGFFLGRPLLAALVLGAILLAPGPLLLQLRLDNAPEAYFPKDAPAVRFNESVREDFPLDQVLVALFAGDDLFSEAFLAKLERLGEAMEADPAVERVLSVITVDHIEASVDGFAVEPLLSPDDGLTAKARQQRALGDRFARGVLVADDGQALALVVRPYPMDTSLERLRLENRLREAVAAQGLQGELAAVAGHIALDVAQLKAMARDVAILLPGTLGISLMLLWWLFRRWLVLALATATISAVTGFALLLLVLLGKPFTLITAIAPPLLTAITVAMLMHLFNAVAGAARRGLTGEARMRAVLAAVARPTVYAGLTTAVGLLSLWASPIRPIETFGLITALGVCLASLLVIGPVPALLLAFDRGPWAGGSRGLQRIDRVTGLLLRLSLRRPAWMLGGGVLLLALSAWQLTRIDVETDLYAFFAQDHPITRATARVEEELAGVMPLELVFEGPATDSLQAPERLAAIADVQAWLDRHPAVDHSASLPDLISEMHWAFHGEDPAYRALPEDGRLVAQYLFIYGGSDLYELVDRDFRRSRVLLNLNAHSAQSLNALLSDLRAYLETNPPADLAWDLAGMGRLFADQERLLIRGQLHSLYAVVGLVSLLMLLMWRRPGLAAVSMVPNVAPVVLIFGLMGLFGIWLDMATAMVASVAVGIALDDTIHLMHGFCERRSKRVPVVYALARAFRDRGRAVVATTLVLCAQFLFMATSSFQPTGVFGWLTAAGLLAALVFDLLVLPALLLLQGRASAAR
jgi:predicted RND superfamily exporter protein